MASLFKFIFYLVIIIFWVLNNTKKQKNWDLDISKKPKRADVPVKKFLQKRDSEIPAREGIFDHSTEINVMPDLASMSYDQVLEMRRKKAKEIRSNRIKEKPAPAVESLSELWDKDINFASASTAPILNKKMKKPHLALKSSAKEGIIWSIILGPPRSRAPFSTKGSPIQR